MHFLCLHGVGTNSHVFETQSAPIRYDMDKNHTFDFAEGVRECAIDPGIRNIFPAKDTYYRYYWDTAEDLSLALQQLGAYIEKEGPFDGVIAFSHGAALISTYLVQLSQRDPVESPPFACVIFLCGTRPFDPAALPRGRMQWLELDADSPRPIDIPTAHIWGGKDSRYGGQSEVLFGFCREANRVAYVHAGGHEIPGPRAEADVQGSARAIRRVVDLASG